MRLTPFKVLAAGMMIFLSACAKTSSPSFSIPSSPLPPAPTLTPLTDLPAPPASWTLTGSSSLYLTLYASTDRTKISEAPPQDLDADGTISDDEKLETISDRIITGVAADLVVQFYMKGTQPLTETENAFVVFRSLDLDPIPPEAFALGSDAKNVPFRFEEVKRWVRDSLILTPDEICVRWPWWLPHEPPPLREKRDPQYPEGIETPYDECLDLIVEVQQALEEERTLRELRQELSLIAYGEESLWDGELSGSGTELRTYDLALDIAGVGNVLGSAPFDLLFDQGNQGEQCDGIRCPSCILPAPELCGNGGVEGAEQCDDGNRIPGDGCDAFCQVEGNYCGNGKIEPWEACDEGKECPDGKLCGSYQDCHKSSGRICPDGNACTSDADCVCPPNIVGNPSACAAWKKDSCRYVFDGVCFVGGMVHGQSCQAQSDCQSLSTCGPDRFCTGLPFQKSCTRDAHCVSCSFEVVWGTCYESDKRCNGNEDCPESSYCIFEPEALCKPRTVTGFGSTRASSCNEFCEDSPRCGDRIVYLDEHGNTEECDDGMHCLDGTSCAFGQRCADGSTCEPRIPAGISPRFCNEQCQWEEVPPQCGDGVLDEEGPDDIPGNADDEECDDGMECENGTACFTSRDCPTTYAYCSGDPRRACQSLFDCPRGQRCLPPNTSNVCQAQENDGCSLQCKHEYCGDSVTQNGPHPTDLHEECDPGSTCTTIPGAADRCTGVVGPTTTACTVNACNPAAQCSGLCKRLGCGNGIIDAAGLDCDPTTLPDNEECDDGNTVDGDGCSASCKKESCFGVVPGSPNAPLGCRPCGDGTVDADGLDNIAGNADDEECEPDAPVSRCVGGPMDGSSCTTSADCNNDPRICLRTCDSPGTCVNGACIGGLSHGQACGIPGGCFVCRTGPANGCSLPIGGPLGTVIVAGCKLPKAGNCAVEGWEQCDDGVTGGGDGCDDGVIEYCGDGTVNQNPGIEECDPPDDPLDSLCCGNGARCTQDADCGANGPCRMQAGQCGLSCTRTVDSCPRPPKTCPASGACGDGCLDTPAEECDDGNTRDNDGCSASCKKEFCGDGVVNNRFEECDPGSNTADCYQCRTVQCGDCRVSPPETCDDGGGNSTSGDGCSTSCQREYCGDGVTQQGLGEQCDDGGLCGNTAMFCRTGEPELCPEIPSVCSSGGGQCQTDADCAPGTCLPVRQQCVQEPCDGCNNQCQTVICGDGRKECNEECDDGNTDPLDGCSPTCMFEFCGDGIVDPDGPDNLPGKGKIDDDLDGVIDEPDEAFFPGTDDEECDSGWGNSDIAPDTCRTNCRLPRCGDGVIDSNESCDSPTCPDGKPCTSDLECGGEWCRNRDNDGNCSAECTIEFCGDGVTQIAYGEQCDDGNLIAGDGCDPSCKHEALPYRVSLCGDGYRELDEQCDDGNTVNGDGCSSVCTVERLDLCGNGIVNTEVGEECDQGHPYNTLECTPYCRLPHRAPLCGDGRKDPSGTGRGNMLERLLSGAEGYRLDWAMPGLAHLFPKERAAGWYATPRVYTREASETPFQLIRERDGFDPVLDQGNCSLCGNGVINTGEECDSGRLSGGTKPVPRTNMREWQRFVWGASYMRFASQYYWYWYGNLFPFGFHTYDALTAFWYIAHWDRSTYVNYIRGFGGWYWYYADAAWQIRGSADEQTLVRDSCSGFCTLQLCGNDRIDPGESCDDDNMEQYGRRLDGDGCSKECFQESGFDFFSGVCGDDVRNLGEECDDGGQCINAEGRPTGRYCRFDSVHPSRNFCPGPDDIEGTLDDETCKVVDGDGCDTACRLEPASRCGNGILEPYEECDNGGMCGGSPPPFACFPAGTSGGVCSTVTVGGTTIVCPAYQDLHCRSDSDCGSSGPCMPIPGDGCSTSCLFEPAVCGNGLVEPQAGETCDPGGVCSGGPNAGKGCSGNAAFCGNGTCTVITTSSICTGTCAQLGSVCGDGKKDGAEQCDDGPKNSDTIPNACRTTCLYPFCGDGILDREEECDDGNTVAKDGCTYCLVDLCGNGLLDTGETCDDGCTAPGIPPGCDAYPLDDLDGCSVWCLAKSVTPICGNAEREGSEECDDGNLGSGDGCSAQCTLEYCGNGVKEPGLGEECDAGTNNAQSPDACRLTCQLPYCGDAIKDSNEACDPGKHCMHDPSVSCKDDQECLLGACTIPVGSFSGTCTGDPTKPCTDDTDCIGQCRVLDTPTCADNCTQKPVCGDGLIHGEEQCDDGNRVSGDGCSEACTLERPSLCGNGKKEQGEQCDDGNRSDHDGCTRTCQIEPMECGGVCANPGARFVCADNVPCQMGDTCAKGVCTLRADCATECTFGLCGNGVIDRGEQCDDGRHCTHDPAQACRTHAECSAGTCNGADLATGTPGTCSSESVRACMTDADCRSLCIPKGGDGCSGECLSEGLPPEPGAFLTVCQEESGVRIGSGQVLAWQQTLLAPHRNPYLQSSSLMNHPLGPWSWEASFLGGFWGWWSGWQGWWMDSIPGCSSAHFPNSLGNHITSIAKCLDIISRQNAMPDRDPLMPFEPTGIASYAACQEPRAKLASIVELPAIPPIALPPYDPSELVANFEQFICRENGYPRRSFLFTCESAEGVALTPPTNRDMLPINLQTGGNSSMLELLLAHSLDVGYRASEASLLQYLEEAVGTLRTSLDSAIHLIQELHRIQFTETICPTDGTALCP